MVWEIKEIEVGQSSMYHLDASSDFEKLKAGNRVAAGQGGG